MKRWIAILAACAVAFCSAAVTRADEPFSVKIKVFMAPGSNDDIYYEPAGNVIKVHGPMPRLFQIEIKNVSSRTEPLYIDSMAGGESQLIFEATDENGNENLVTRQLDIKRSNKQDYRHLSPGKSVNINMVLGEDDWKNAGRLVQEGAKKIKFRAIYKSGSRTIYSDYYTAIID